MKIDVVMWTYNSARTLAKCLGSIDSAIPQSCICHRIAVDGGSTDGTQDFLRAHGWAVNEAPRKGIPFQANCALQLVDAKFFAAFEHDIIPNQNWFERTSKVIDSDETIGAVQGLRLFTGSKTMEALDAWRYHTNRIPYWTWSIDNTLFRTEAVRRSGGFSDECMASTDAVLRENMFRLGYKWITDNALISGHYRRNLYEHLKHQARIFRLANYYWVSSTEDRTTLKRALSLLGGNPLNALRMALYSRMLRVPIGHYVIRLQAAFYLNIFPLRNKAMRRIPMDDWYLREFKRLVRYSKHNSANGARRRNSPPEYQCVVCATKTPFSYSVPRNWGDIVPKLKRGIHREFAACSEHHADIVADKVFKSAFDYIGEEHSNKT